MNILLLSLISKLFNKKDLDNLHQQSNESYRYFNEPTKDSDTEFHKVFTINDEIGLVRVS